MRRFRFGDGALIDSEKSTCVGKLLADQIKREVSADFDRLFSEGNFKTEHLAKPPDMNRGLDWQSKG